jgi:hypothetical protein
VLRKKDNQLLNPGGKYRLSREIKEIHQNLTRTGLSYGHVVPTKIASTSKIKIIFFILTFLFSRDT